MRRGGLRKPEPARSHRASSERGSPPRCRDPPSPGSLRALGRALQLASPGSGPSGCLWSDPGRRKSWCVITRLFAANPAAVSGVRAARAGAGPGLLRLTQGWREELLLPVVNTKGWDPPLPRLPMGGLFFITRERNCGTKTEKKGSQELWPLLTPLTARQRTEKTSPSGFTHPTNTTTLKKSLAIPVSRTRQDAPELAAAAAAEGSPGAVGP